MIIYKITNYKNGKIYIGQTIRSIHIRWKEHVRMTSECEYLKNAIKKHGENSFFREVIDFATSMHELNYLEEFWIEFYDSANRDKGYNIELGGKNSKSSLITKEKIKISNTGKKRSKETKLKISQSKKGFKHTEEAKQIIGEKSIGRLHTEEQKDLQRKTKRFKKPLNKNFKGVYFHKKQQSFNSIIVVNNKHLHLGSFKSEVEAAIVYNNAVDKYWNGDGYKNIIPS